MSINVNLTIYCANPVVEAKYFPSKWIFLLNPNVSNLWSVHYVCASHKFPIILAPNSQILSLTLRNNFFKFYPVLSLSALLRKHPKDPLQRSIRIQFQSNSNLAPILTGSYSSSDPVRPFLVPITKALLVN